MDKELSKVTATELKLASSREPETEDSGGGGGGDDSDQRLRKIEITLAVLMERISNAATKTDIEKLRSWFLLTCFGLGLTAAAVVAAIIKLLL